MVIYTKHQIADKLGVPVSKLAQMEIKPSYCHCQLLNYFHKNGIIISDDDRKILTTFSDGGEDCEYASSVIELMLLYRSDKHRAIVCEKLPDEAWQLLKRRVKVCATSGECHKREKTLSRCLEYARNFL